MCDGKKKKSVHQNSSYILLLLSQMKYMIQSLWRCMYVKIVLFVKLYTRAANRHAYTFNAHSSTFISLYVYMYACIFMDTFATVYIYLHTMYVTCSYTTNILCKSSAWSLGTIVHINTTLL